MKTVLYPVLALALAPAAGGFATASASEAFPARPVRWIVPFPAGGGVDLVGRLVGQKLSEMWGEQVVIDNRPGAGGRVGTQLAAGATADGQTQLLTLNTNLTVDRSLFSKLPYDPAKAFEPITILASTSQLLVVNPSFPAKTVKDLVAAAKAQPGKINYGSSGVGGSLHLAMELLEAKARIRMTHVAYKGGPPAAADLMAGRISVMFFNTPAALANVKAGKLRALGVSTAHRSPLLPDVPTIAESGVPGFNTEVWYGLAVPAGAPRAAIRKTYDDVARILAMPDTKAALLRLGAEPVQITPAQMAARVKRETLEWAKVVRAAKISFDH